MLKLRDVLGGEMPAIQVLDIGAMAEGKDRYAPLVEQGLARVTGFEPNDAERAKLEGRAHHRYLPNMLGHGGKATFRVARYPGSRA